jgi:hypothetical protein
MELKPCPFCGAGETVSEADSKHWTGRHYNILSWRVRHWCAYKHHAPILCVMGRTQEEAETRWNMRHTVTDQAPRSSP